MAGLGPNEITVLVRGAWKNDRTGRYIREFVGLTVGEAIDCLRSHDRKRGGLPKGIIILSPFGLNGENVTGMYDRILQQGDVFSMDDP